MLSKAETDRIVHEAVRKAQKKGVRIALTGYIIFFGGIVTERHIASGENRAARQTIVKSSTAVAVSACNERFRDRKSIRAVLIASRLRARTSDSLSPEQRQAQINFLNERLAHLPMPDCRAALTILSADPDAEVRVPEPLYLKTAPENRDSDGKQEEREQRNAGGG